MLQDLDFFLDSVLFSQLSEAEWLALKIPISMEELKSAFLAMSP